MQKVALSPQEKMQIRANHAAGLAKEVGKFLIGQSSDPAAQRDFNQAAADERAKQWLDTFLRSRLGMTRLSPGCGDEGDGPCENAVLSSEGTPADFASLSAMWVLNALNGRANFSRRQHDQYAASIAFWSAARPVIGLTVIPGADSFRLLAATDCEFPIEFYYHEGLHEPPKYRTSDRMGGLGVTVRGEVVASSGKVFDALMNHTRGGVKVHGSVAFSLAQVAAGYWDFYYHPGPKVFDAAAGLVHLKQAGRVTNLGPINLKELGEEFRLPPLIAAVNPQVLAEVQEVISKALAA